MSENENKPERPDPVLQPMRIVQVAESELSQPGMSGPPIATPTNPKGKKLVMSKKDIEAAARAKAESEPTLKPKPNMNIPYNFPGPDTITIDNSARNARANRNVEQLAEYDEDWLAKTGGQPVARAWLQTAVSISEFISSEASFTPQKIRGLTMSWFPEGLKCQIKTHKNTGVFFIPSANVKIMEFR